ncbi:MAG: hypothetical protein ACKV1O_19715 [Saprospiraceae bacterium]
MHAYSQVPVGCAIERMHDLTPFVSRSASSRAGGFHSPKHTSFTERRSGQGGLVSIAHSALVRAYLPFAQPVGDSSLPRRKSLYAPEDNNTFVKPLKQCFVKNPRLMPMTRIMLTLLSGWAGQGGSIETTIGIVAKHLGRCRRQVFRYLQDAAEEGYVYYSKTKDRIGRYTGVRIKLNFAAIRFTHFRKTEKRSKPAATIEVTHESETNDKFILKREDDPDLWQRLECLATSAGYEMPKTAPS